MGFLNSGLEDLALPLALLDTPYEEPAATPRLFQHRAHVLRRPTRNDVPARGEQHRWIRCTAWGFPVCAATRPRAGLETYLGFANCRDATITRMGQVFRGDPGHIYLQLPPSTG